MAHQWGHYSTKFSRSSSQTKFTYCIVWHCGEDVETQDCKNEHEEQQ